MGSEGGCAGSGEGDVESEEIYVEITQAERAAVRTIQSRGSEDPGINWEAIARHLQISVEFLRALARIRLPKHTNLIPMSSLDIDQGEYLSE
jgi:hypothetical protein